MKEIKEQEFNTNISDLFLKGFNIDYKNMKQDSFIDVRDKGIQILSFDRNKNENVYKTINILYRKKDTKAYKVIQETNSFLCSKEHRLSIKFDVTLKEFTFLEIGDLLKIKKPFYSLNKYNNWLLTSIEKTNQVIPILDVEVDDTHCFYTNEILSHNSYGSPEVRSGGNAPKYYSSIILDTRRREVIGDKDSPVGFITQVKVAKNKCGSPFKSALIELYLGPDKYGIDTFSEIVDIAAENGIIQKGGAWYKYIIDGNEERWQGKINVVKFLRENLNIYEEIKNIVYKTVLKKDAPEENSFSKAVFDKIEEKKERKKRKKEDEGNFEEISESIVSDMKVVNTPEGVVDAETGEILEEKE